jgi:hypothetical protein
MYPSIKLMFGLIYKMRERLHNPESYVEFTTEEKAMLSRDKEQIQNLLVNSQLFKNLPKMLDWWEDANMKRIKDFMLTIRTH